MRIITIFILTFAVSSTAISQTSLTEGDGFVSVAEGLKLYYRIVGNNEQNLILLLHGGPGSHINAVWPDLEPLAKKFKILMYDQRGGGHSDIIKDPKLLTADNHVNDLETIRKYFGIPKMMIVGESWGSGLALLYASKYPQHVDRIVFLGPMPPTKALAKKRFDQVNETTNFYARLAELRSQMPTTQDPIGLCHEMFAAYLKPYFADPGAMQRRRGDSCNAPPEAVRNYTIINDAGFASLGDWNFIPLLSHLKIPSLVIEGEKSAPTIASAKAWAEALPNGQLQLVPNAGHFPHVEQPNQFFPAIEKFLSNTSSHAR
jgi:proline iminopeptidase